MERAIAGAAAPADLDQVPEVQPGEHPDQPVRQPGGLHRLVPEHARREDPRLQGLRA